MKFNVTIDGRVYTHSSSSHSVRIGRTAESEFVLDHNEISKVHCLLESQDATYFITDLGSKNGTFIDGLKIEPHHKMTITSEMNVLLADKFSLQLKSDQKTQQFQVGTSTNTVDLKTSAADRRAMSDVPKRVPKLNIPRQRSSGKFPAFLIPIGVSLVVVSIIFMGVKFLIGLNLKV